MIPVEHCNCNDFKTNIIAIIKQDIVWTGLLFIFNSIYLFKYIDNLINPNLDKLLRVTSVCWM